MGRKIVVCIIAGFLGILSAILGFAAESKRIKCQCWFLLGPLGGTWLCIWIPLICWSVMVSDVQLTNSGGCTYPRSPALALGLTAGVALVLAQVVLYSTSVCIFCQQHSSRAKWITSFICFIFSWVLFALAFLLLMTGAALNDEHVEEKYFGDNCNVEKTGVFTKGAILSLACVSLGIFYYAALALPKKKPWDPDDHQDTYNTGFHARRHIQQEVNSLMAIESL